METVNIQYEGSFTSTYTMYTREEYVKALDIGRKWGWTKGNHIYVKRQNMEKAMDEVHGILRARIRKF
jgi:hypothetical protein